MFCISFVCCTVTNLVFWLQQTNKVYLYKSITSIPLLVSYLLQVEHPSTDVEQQWRKAVSLQRKRAVMACFRMIPVYNLSRSFIHLPFNTAPTHSHTRLMALFLDYPGQLSERWNQSGFYWSKRQWVAVASAGPYALRSRQITTPLPHRSVFYRPDALPAAQPTASKHWKAYFLKFVTLYKLFLCVLCFALCALFHPYHFLCIARVWWVIIMI